MIREFIGALSEVGIDLDAELIAEAAWLALNMSLKQQAADEGREPVSKPVKADQQPVRGPASGQKSVNLAEESGLEAQDSTGVEGSTDLYAFAGNAGASRQPGGGTPLRTPGASALPGALDISKALRPLMLKAPSRTGRMLDADATADRVAQNQSRIWDVVMRPAPARWLGAAVIVDDSETMFMWRETVRELLLLLTRQGAFHDVRLWRLDSSRLDAPKIFAGARAVERSPKELFDPSGRRAVLVVSDCMGAAWFGQRLPEMLEAWGRQMPLCILQVLPQKLWSQTGLVRTRQVRVRSSVAGVPNSRLTNLNPSRWAELRKRPEVCIPVAWLDRDYIRDWASIVAGRGDSTAYAVAFTEMPEGLRQHRSRKRKPERVLSEFRELASKPALKLAELFAAAPLTLPTMRLIQRTMVPESRQHHLAEVLNSGILKPESVSRDVDPDSVRYEFLPRVQDMLLDVARASDSVQVLKTVLSAEVEERIGTTVDFLALLRDPHSVGEVTVSDSDRPFAEVAAKVLQRLGGKYAQIARQLRAKPRTAQRDMVQMTEVAHATAAMNIVLVHGILGFSEKFGIEYFLGVAEHFRQKGIRVHVPQLDPTRGIEFRGDQLRNQITAAFTTGVLDANQKTHIIAHSMGGLDSRYMLSPVNPNGIQKPIRSLTTISTPHLGSPIADILDHATLLLPFPHLPFNPPGNPLEAALNKLGISLDGLRDLTSDRCRAFSIKYENRPGVAYFSVAGSGRPDFPQTAAAFLLFYHYIWGITGQPNDGLVTMVSARWGTFDPETWPADHAEEVGHNLIMPPAFPYLAKYDQIVANVANL